MRLCGDGSQPTGHRQADPGGCFVTDLGTVLALVDCSQATGGCCSCSCGYRVRTVLSSTNASLVVANVGHRVSEPEVKVIFVVLLALGDWRPRRVAKQSYPRTWRASWWRGIHE